MNNLTVINRNGQLLVDSREVAEMVEKQHKDLLGSMRGYIQHLVSENFRSSDFFIESTYIDNANREKPCYLLTKKGCDLVANKMTGEKGILFTAEYVTQFDEMEQQLKGNNVTCLEDVLISQLQEMKNMRLQLQETKEQTASVKQEVNDIKEIIIINPKAEWRKQTNNLIAKICKKINNYQLPKEETYRALENRAKCNLKIRLNNLQVRALANGTQPSKVKALNNLDIIENDTKLKEIYIAIVKEMAIKHGITEGEKYRR